MGCLQSNLSTARLDPSLCSTTPFQEKYARKVSGLTEERFLGQGSFGRVVLIEDKQSRDTYALKIIAKRRRTGGDEKLLESLRTEITILREYGRHENILQLRDVYDRPTSVLLVEELATGGDLLGWATHAPSRTGHQHLSFTEGHAASATRQILKAVAYLHDRNVVHRDIKPDNVLVRDRRSFVIKVADFGCSKILEKGQATAVQSKKGYEQLMDSFVGTKVYAAPEILRHKPYDSSVDEYSTGVLVALLLTGKHPLSDIEVDTNLALASCDVPFLIDFSDKKWSRVNKAARDVARALARCDPAKRIRAKDALRSFPWLDEAASVVEAPALPDDVLERLRRTRLDGVQALALRSVVSTPKVSTFAKEADQLFEALDADSTGLVRRNEVLRLAHGRLRRVDLELAFDHADLAGDGVVTKDEFKCALLATRGDLVAQLVDAAFAALDVSHTGKITASDVMACAAGLGVKVDASDVQKWIASHDVAGDGELSRDEFQKMMSSVADSEFRAGEKLLTKL
ncbi:unnamed protein product [Pelagomonas calceolata]|uniref:Calmodulin n=1 Tax=Pelagomonas calceolata TaxID=35677 RepID=A0A7S4E5W4_9STRA|nr:unnamed protein product [Pelagomonas calceolata]